jgi:hypothetical protein
VRVLSPPVISLPVLRTIAAVAALALLAGCATPLDRCILRAERETRLLQEELTERRVNLARGYAIERRIQPQMAPVWCRDRYGRPYTCIDWVDTVREFRRPINVTTERERVALLERAIAREREIAERQIAACRAQFAEG